MVRHRFQARYGCLKVERDLDDELKLSLLIVMFIKDRALSTGRAS
jgi:hypothetical protein